MGRGKTILHTRPSKNPSRGGENKSKEKKNTTYRLLKVRKSWGPLYEISREHLNCGDRVIKRKEKRK